MSLPFIIKQLKILERSQNITRYSFTMQLINRLILFIIFLFVLMAYLASLNAMLLYLLLTKKGRSVKASGSYTSKIVSNLRYQGYVMGLNDDSFAQYFSTSLAKVEVILYILFG